MHTQYDTELSKICEKYSAPILRDFVWWVLIEAKRRNIRKLYFLARDGYVMREVALVLCEKFNLDIECRYLYTSRAALRMPTYHLIGEEAYDLLLGYSYQVTPNSMLQRALLSDTVKAKILREVGITEEQKDELLTRIETFELSDKIRRNALYRESVCEMSRKAYPITIEYFTQEKLFEDSTVAIVDSGWNGSMQRSLRQLMDAEHYQGEIIGFYFGLFQEPPQMPNSTYLHWYFGPSGQLSDKVRFSNNLFECICAAPHGTTLGYQYSQNGIVPVFGDTVSEKQNEFVRRQIELITNFASEQIADKKFKDFKLARAERMSRQLIRQLMYRPKPEIVAAFQQMQFCDDIYESYYSALANEAQTGQLKNYTLFAQFKRALKKTAVKTQDLAWPYGVVALLPAPKRLWYRWNILAWEILKNSPARRIYSQLKKHK